MKNFLFLVLVATLSALCGVVANSSSRPSNSAPKRFVLPEKLLKPGEKFVFHAGEDDPVQETAIQNCIDNANEIRLQIKTVSFADGTIWKAISGDFPGIRSSSP